MEFRIGRGVLLLMLAIFICGSLFAATPAKKKNLATKGTTQLKSDYNDPNFGQTFTLGKTAPINITVNSAEYSVDQFVIGNGIFLAKANQKILILHYTLHNPNKTDYGLAWGTLQIFGVDANNKNWEYCKSIGVESTKTACNTNLKPGQKIQLYTGIIMPAKDPLPKLMIQSRDRLVLRYNLLKKDKNGNYVNKVKPLPAPITDPNDPTGGTALEKVPGQIGEFYPLLELDVKADSIEFTDLPIKNIQLKNGERFLTAIITARNDMPNNASFRWSTVKPKLTDIDGGDIGRTDDALYASRDETINATIEPGKEIRARYFFKVPAGVQLKEISFKQSADGREYIYDLTNLK